MMEIERLVSMLDEACIPYERDDDTEYNRLVNVSIKRIKYPCNDNFICSAIQGDYTLGGRENLIEIMGLLTDEEHQYDEVRGYLTADEVFQRIKTDWDAHSVEP